MPNDEENQQQTGGNSENQQSSEETENQDSVVEEDEGPPFHPHRGKIMDVLQYTEISSMSFDKSYEDSTANGKIEFVFSPDDMKYIYDGVSCKLKLRRDTDRQFSSTGIEEVFKDEKEIIYREHYPTDEQLVDAELTTGMKEFVDDDVANFDVDSTIVCRSASDDGLYGFVTEVKHSQKGSEISVKDWGYCLEDTGKKLEFNGLLRSHVIEEVAKSYGLTPIVDFTGLDDDLVNWTNMKEVSKGSSSSSDGASVNGDGSMTEDQMWEIYKTFVYGGWGSGHDPKKAWEKMGTTKGASADCYDATAWAYYVYNYKIGIPARDICYHSDHAPSGSHHTIQIYKNKEWIDPPQLSGITSGLGGGAKGKDFHVCREPPNNGNMPEYVRCPYSNND